MLPPKNLRIRSTLLLARTAIFLFPLVAIASGCGGMEFCDDGSRECSTAGGSSASAAGSSGNVNGGSGGSAGEAHGGTTGSGGGGGGSVAVPCSDLSSPEEGCTPASGAAIFVSPLGDDDNGGDKDAPVASIAKGVELAIAAGQPLLVCNGAFDEAMQLGSSETGLSIQGGFSCEGWVYAASERPLVAPSAGGYALRIEGSSGISIADIEFLSAHADEPGESSIAAFVSESDGITLTRVKLLAGKGADGREGQVEEETYPPLDDLTGNSASGVAGGPAKTCLCTIGQTTGGAGGSGKQAGGYGLPDHPGEGGEGGLVGTCTVGTGKDGAPGPAGSDGDGAPSLGALSSEGWLPRAGTAAGPGQPGQGGGGGAGGDTSGGGGGGCGGCGGNGGGAGEGGGASIGLLAFDSVLTLDAVSIITSAAGRGGDGALGQTGQQRSASDATAGYGGVQSPGGCQGGKGGKGGGGGRGGGGAGGVSAGIVFQGESPAGVDLALIMVGAGGPKGEGGGEPAPDGASTPALELL